VIHHPWFAFVPNPLLLLSLSATLRLPEAGVRLLLKSGARIAVRISQTIRITLAEYRKKTIEFYHFWQKARKKTASHHKSLSEKWLGAAVFPVFEKAGLDTKDLGEQVS
jgi:hypothetical protein